MATLSFKVSMDEEAAIRYRMKQAGAENLSAYLRRVCLSGSYGSEAQLGRVQRQLDVVTEALEQTQRLLRLLVNQKSDNFELHLLAGLYMLLYPSVERSVQATVDRYLDVGSIEGFLQKQQ